MGIRVKVKTLIIVNEPRIRHKLISEKFMSLLFGGVCGGCRQRLRLCLQPNVSHVPSHSYQ